MIGFLEEDYHMEVNVLVEFCVIIFGGLREIHRQI